MSEQGDISPLLTHAIDDYIRWFVAWHRAARGEASCDLDPPPSFDAWRSEALQSPGDQPAIENLTTRREQLHKLVKLVLIKTAPGHLPARGDDESVSGKYLELMQELRRFERAFAAAASDLDPLTGLRTRAVLTRELQREISRSARSQKPFCVAILDIDHFKAINDTYGHDGGDRVLSAVADHISRGMRAHDDAYRIGGEEFLLGLKETDAATGLQILERLRAGLEGMPVTLADGRNVKVTASFGLAAATKATTPDALLRRADDALYRAKRDGRNRVVVAE